MKAQDTIVRMKRADLAGSGGAGILGVGLGLLLMDLLPAEVATSVALALTAIGGALHGWGMYEKHRIEGGMEVPRWSSALYWLCWIALGILLVWISLAALSHE